MICGKCEKTIPEGLPVCPDLRCTPDEEGIYGLANPDGTKEFGGMYLRLD